MTTSEAKRYHLGESWLGRGDHDGHTITAVEAWPTRVDRDGHVSSGRVRCNCGDEWDTTIWPAA